MFEDCQKEVIDLHDFFEQWFKADIENSDEVYSRLEKVLNEKFMLIMPSGEYTFRKELLEQLRSGHGSRSDSQESYRLWIENINLRYTLDDLCLVTYEEWAEINGKLNARLSSALFRKKEGTKFGVEWLHVHETLIPAQK
ncbi:MAG: hypothetical protein FK733_15050 [Asgard group archaeon]|nr:hypothetical protein [Asgard group archaeon]